MDNVESDPDLEMILQDMRQEFRDATNDRLDEVETAIANMLGGKGQIAQEILEIKRHIHSIKSAGASFGFSAVGIWAHSLEDYLETTDDFEVDQIWDIQLFVDRIREVMESGINPSDPEIATAVRNLPLKGVRHGRGAVHGARTVLLVTPKGLQRKIISRELSDLGFKVIIADASLEAIDMAITLQPDLVFASQVIDRISGIELSQVLTAIDATADQRFLLMVSSDEILGKAALIPDHVGVVHKGRSFARELMAYLRVHELI